MSAATKTAPPVKAIQVVYVDPETAKNWLDTRYSNERPLREAHANGLARDMENDKWYFTGDPVRFHKDTGRLVDGQHRLEAVVRSGIGQWFAILNLPEEARSAIDSGRAPRSLGDFLGYRGYVSGQVVAAIARRLVLYYSNQGTGRYKPTFAECISFVEDNRERMERSTQVALRSHNVRLPLAPSSMGSAYFLCESSDEDLAREFFERLLSGIGLQEGDPVAALRGRAVRHISVVGRNMEPEEAFRFIVMAWNATKSERNLDRLVRPKGGWNKDNAPRVQ